MAQLTLQRYGDAVGIELPQEIRARLGLEVGQQLTAVELHDGLKLVKHSATLERQLEVGRRVLEEQADVLRGLAEYDSN